MKNFEENKQKLKFIDLFAGIGGFSLALENNGMECVFASEIDIHCAKVYKDNFGKTPVGDITKINASEIPDFDFLTAGFPCQPFSFAGNKQGFSDKTRGTLFFDICRILEEKKPEMFLLENVKGLRTHDKGETLRIITKTLTDLGYTIYHKVLKSYDFGVPQYRERWYCVGFKKNIPFIFPEGNKRRTTIRDIVDNGNNDESLKLSDFELDRIDHHFTNMENYENGRVPHDNSKYAPNTKKGKHGIFSYLKPDTTLRFHVGDKAKSQIQEAYYVSLDSVAPTIIATRAPKLWDLRRKFSILECKRIQGFPDNFKMDVSDLQARKQLGNSITVTVVDMIVKTMLFYHSGYNEVQNQKLTG